MRFAKYHGIGNDFVMIADPDDRLVLEQDVVRRLCERRFGIGGDGVIRVAPGHGDADFFMDYVNSDGSIGEMCGNGIRCLAVFARERGLTTANVIEIETRAGLKVVEVQDDGRVRVDMGAPIFTPAEIPMSWDGANALHAKLELPEGAVEAACLSMGNPHAVLFVDDPETAPVTTTGPLIEHHEAFPQGTNAEFARVLSPDRIRMRVWERGSGETLACGTGACAVAVASRLVMGTEPSVVVELPGGELEVSWEGDPGVEASVFMTGPVTKSFEGRVDIEGDVVA